MLQIDIPGKGTLHLHTLLLDYNGTIAADGALIPGIAEKIHTLQKDLRVLVLTADTYGTVTQACGQEQIEVRTFPQAGAAACKAEIASSFAPGVVCLGNGWNDMEMFDASDLAIAVIDREGMCAALLSHADVLVTSPADGLDLLLKPDRLRATLRT